MIIRPIVVMSPDVPVRYYMRTFGIKFFSRFAAVGWSDGGIVALLAAIHHPEVVTKVNMIIILQKKNVDTYMSYQSL